MKSPIAAASIFILSFAGTAASLALIALTPHERLPVGLRVEDVARFVGMQASLTVVGALIVWRRPGNRVGWYLSGAALCSAVQLFAAGYAVYGVLSDTGLPRAELAAWSFAWLGAGLGLFSGLVVLSYPDGRIRSSRAKVGVALVVLVTALIVTVAALRPGPLLNMPIVDNPFGLDQFLSAQDSLIALAAAAFVGVIALAVSTLWGRLQRSVGDERQQFKWLLAAAGITGASYAIAFPLIFVDWEAAKNVIAIGMCPIPLSIGVAILRHRLYDIDVLINRTLVYGATTATLLGLYAVIVLIALTLLRPVTQGSELAVAVSTLAVASLIQPVRRRIQHGVDRRFYRSRYDAARTLDAFGTRLRNEVDIDALRRDLVDVVRDTMEPAHASVWLRPQ